MWNAGRRIIQAVPVEFTDQAVTLSGTMITLDEGSDWYFVRAGDVFGPRSGEESPYPQFVGWRNLETEGGGGPVTFSPALDSANGLEDGPDDFYLGVATSNWSDEDWWYGDDSPPWPGRHIFGWVKLRLIEESGEYHLEQLESNEKQTESGPCCHGMCRTARQWRDGRERLLLGDRRSRWWCYSGQSGG
jgi:hypothetical protein